MSELWGADGCVCRSGANWWGGAGACRGEVWRRAWKWVVGVPVLLVVLFLGFGATRPVDPERERAKAVYEGCKDQLASTDRARLDTARTLAAICEGYRADYIRKYQRNP